MPMASFDEDLTLLADAAREAGDIAMGFFRRDPEVWWKEGDSPVSEADFAVDRYLKRTLIGARPAYGWLSEESAPEDRATDADASPRRFFVVDPIDGTRAFLRGEDRWCVSIAVVEDGRPVAGVIDAPVRRERFTASANGAALLNGAAIHVRPSEPGAKLRLAMSDAARRRLSPEAAGRIAFASNAPSLAYRLAEVARGAIDGTLIRPHASDWDIAAGDLILERAGGALVDASGAARLYKIEGRRHGVLVAAARPALEFLVEVAQAFADA